MLFKNQNQIIENGNTTELKNIRKDVLHIFSSAIDAVDPYEIVKSKFIGNKIVINSKPFDLSDFKNIYLIGFGKASVGMGQGVCDSVNIKKGLVISNEPFKKVKNKSVLTLVGPHPIPNKKSVANTNKLLDLIKKCGKNDLLIVLISGGGSSLLCKPRIKIKDLQLAANLLLESGANIKEINTVRKHLSLVKGGQLVTYVKCTVISFIISDIVGDPLEFISSGPTCPDSTTYFDAKKVIQKYGLWDKIPFSIKKTISAGIQGKIQETIKQDNPVFDRVYNFIVANNEIACKAAVKKAANLGYNAKLLSTSVTGEARKAGLFLIKKVVDFDKNTEKIAFISGGETTVKVKGKGKGGRNIEMVLGSVKELSNKNMIFSSFATDGIDGNSSAAGAIADGNTYTKSKNAGLRINKFLDENNSYGFFNKIGDLLITNKTGTNVMDVQILIKIK